MLFANGEGNLDEDQLRILFDWTNTFKSKRLQKVKDPYARNLVSRLLMKDPFKRPDASHALAHPFFSGKRAARMVGEEAEYDVFLSYRVNSDFCHCKVIYEMLTEKGLRVWWDKTCLRAGVDWEEGFCEGLIKSKAFAPLLSRSGLESFEGLTESSSCDNVLLEYRLALELQSFNLLEAVFPVFIGDSSADSVDTRLCTYTNYFKSGCSPKCPDIVVKSVEEKLCEHLNNQGLGAPFSSNRTVKEILQALSAHQGGFIQGSGGDAFTDVVDSIYSMIKPARDLSGTIDGNDRNTVIISKSELDVLKLENDVLRYQKLELEEFLHALISSAGGSRSLSGTTNKDDKKTVPDNNKSELDYVNRELEILWSGITKINALTSDAAVVIDSSGQSSYSNTSKAMNISDYIILHYTIIIYITYCQDVARDMYVNSVRSSVVKMINAVQELRKPPRDSDLQRAKEFTQTTSEDILDTNKGGESSDVTGNGCFHLFLI